MNLALFRSSNLNYRGTEIMADFTITWNKERSYVNQKERSIIIFLSFLEESVDLVRSSFIFQKRTGESPNWKWKIVIDPPDDPDDLDDDTQIGEKWKFRIGGSQYNWYIVADADEGDNNFEGNYRFQINEDAFGMDKPMGRVNLPGENDQPYQFFNLIDKEKALDRSLYMTGLSNNTIYTLNRYTGIAERISNRTNFSRENDRPDNVIDQIFPQDLQLIDQTDGREQGIYMLGACPPGLFLVSYLDHSNIRGEARKVERTVDNFGLTSGSIDALAVSSSNIWLVSNSILYSVNPESLSITKINSSFLSTEGLAYGSFNPLEEDKLYQISNSKLRSVDLNSGILNIQEFDTGSSIRSLVFLRNILYALKQDAIYKIKKDGMEEKIGEDFNIKIVSQDELHEERDPQGMTSDGENLYIIGASRDGISSIYRIDLDSKSPDFGRGIKVIDLNLKEIHEKGKVGKIFYFNNDLYMHELETEKVFIVDINTGKFIQPPSYGFGNSDLVLTGLTERNGQLYAVGILGSVASLFKIDKNTGIALKEDDFRDNFGPVNQTFPTALAYASGSPSVCYMVGTQHANRFKQAALYTLNLENGIATKIGSNNITNFGVREYSPSGLAYIPSSNGDSNGTLYMVGTATAKLYTIDIDKNSDEYGKATVVDKSVLGFNVNEILPQGLTYIEDRTRVSLGLPEEFPGSVAPNRIYGEIEPVVRKNVFYLDATWNKNIDVADFSESKHTILNSNGGGDIKIENVGTEGSSYQFRLRVSLNWDGGRSSSNYSISITIPPVDGSPQISKKIAVDLDHPKYDIDSWRIYTESGSWKKITERENELTQSVVMNTLLPAIVTVELKNSTTVPIPEDFFIEKVVNGVRTKSSNDILSVVKVGESGDTQTIRLRVQIPLNEIGILRIGAKPDTLVNQRGVLGPVSRDLFEKIREGDDRKIRIPNNFSGYFAFDTI